MKPPKAIAPVPVLFVFFLATRCAHVDDPKRPQDETSSSAKAADTMSGAGISPARRLYFRCVCENNTAFEPSANSTYEVGTCQLSTCSPEAVCLEFEAMAKTKCSPVHRPHEPSGAFEEESCRRSKLRFKCSGFQ
jgi:hypothetical protein